MGHIVRIESQEQFGAALQVLDYVPGTWHARGPSTAPVLYLPDAHYKALVEAGVINANGKEEKGPGKKETAKKAKP